MWVLHLTGFQPLQLSRLKAEDPAFRSPSAAYSTLCTEAVLRLTKATAAGGYGWWTAWEMLGSGVGRKGPDTKESTPDRPRSRPGSSCEAHSSWSRGLSALRSARLWGEGIPLYSWAALVISNPL